MDENLGYNRSTALKLLACIFVLAVISVAVLIQQYSLVTVKVGSDGVYFYTSHSVSPSLRVVVEKVGVELSHSHLFESGFSKKEKERLAVNLESKIAMVATEVPPGQFDSRNFVYHGVLGVPVGPGKEKLFAVWNAKYRYFAWVLPPFRS